MKRIKELDYRKNMLKVFFLEVSQFKDIIDYANRTAEIMERYKKLKETLSFSDMELTLNILEEDKIIHGKRFPKGMKITKLLTKYYKMIIKENEDQSHWRQHFEGLFQKIVGRFKSDPKDWEGDLIFSVLPEDFIQAGIIGNSCLSPEGENEHSIFANMSYKNTAVAYSSDNSWRAFVFIDKKAKKYVVLSGYPQENYLLNFSVMRVLEQKGYELVKGSDFKVEHYFDTSAPFNDMFDNINGYYLDDWHTGLGYDIVFAEEIGKDRSLAIEICDYCDRAYIPEGDEQRKELEVCDSCFEDNYVYLEKRDAYVAYSEVDLDCLQDVIRECDLSDSDLEELNPILSCYDPQYLIDDGITEQQKYILKNKIIENYHLDTYDARLIREFLDLFN